LHHRGPDASGCIQAGQVSLGHTRLSILDPSERSNQPFTYNSVTVAYNGELWNYRALRKQLEGAGHAFHTTGDTEVVACALHHWGIQALPKMDGMFAIAWVVDREPNSVYLARDRYGEIPLHVSLEAPVLFASERKALVAMGATADRVEDVSAGQCWRFEGSTFDTYQFYDMPSTTTGRYGSPVELLSLLTEATRIREISDVGVCTQLSGGIDSAAITYLMAQHVPDLVAYTAVYQRNSRDHRCAKEVAFELGIDLVEVPVEKPAPGDMADVVWHIEQPWKVQVEIGWASLCLARAMRSDGFKVTFTGDGSDELWGSYNFSQLAFATGADWFQYRRRLYRRLARTNFQRNNKIFMAHSVECRAPFCHQPLVEFALSLSREAVTLEGQSLKGILQEAFRGLLPDSVIDRPKVGFQDGLGIKKDIAHVVVNPKRFYRGVYKRLFEGG
jgi:asparagine synthase (glutamine-hydrolysing)